MDPLKVHLRHCILYEFQLGHNASESARNLCAALGRDVVDVRTVQRWFSRFRAGNTDLEDEGRTGRPSTFNEDFLKSLIQDDPYITTRELEEKMGYDHTTIVVAKPGIQRKKRMLCIWWDRSGPIYYELLPHSQVVSADLYCQLLSNLDKEIKRKRPTLANRKGIILLQDNARPHVALKTRKKLDELCYEVLPHPAYSPDVAPSDYHLFLSLQNFLNGRSFRNDDEVKSALSEYFSKKDRVFFESGIDKLPDKWRQVVNNNGQYIVN
uniref:HTH_48 domain-containing protein n=1 Tax=Strongyloides papillosus TaxID=174720 RepID=A0A0N5BM18_STREA